MGKEAEGTAHRLSSSQPPFKSALPSSQPSLQVSPPSHLASPSARGGGPGALGGGEGGGEGFGLEEVLDRALARRRRATGGCRACAGGAVGQCGGGAVGPRRDANPAARPDAPRGHSPGEESGLRLVLLGPGALAPKPFGKRLMARGWVAGRSNCEAPPMWGSSNLFQFNSG